MLRVIVAFEDRSIVRAAKSAAWQAYKSSQQEETKTWTMRQIGVGRHRLATKKIVTQRIEKNGQKERRWQSEKLGYSSLGVHDSGRWSSHMR